VSVDDPNVIDTVGVEKTTGKVILSIYDHHDWDDEEAHELLLQEKLNRYLAFIESGEMYEAYPNARGRTPVISVVMRVEPTEDAKAFLDAVETVISQAGIEFRRRVSPA
jgi:hypothetical protein